MLSLKILIISKQQNLFDLKKAVGIPTVIPIYLFSQMRFERGIFSDIVFFWTKILSQHHKHSKFCSLKKTNINFFFLQIWSANVPKELPLFSQLKLSRIFYHKISPYFYCFQHCQPFQKLTFFNVLDFFKNVVDFRKKTSLGKKCDNSLRVADEEEQKNRETSSFVWKASLKHCHSLSINFYHSF